MMNKPSTEPGPCPITRVATTPITALAKTMLTPRPPRKAPHPAPPGSTARLDPPALRDSRCDSRLPRAEPTPGCVAPAGVKLGCAGRGKARLRPGRGKARLRRPGRPAPGLGRLSPVGRPALDRHPARGRARAQVALGLPPHDRKTPGIQSVPAGTPVARIAACPPAIAPGRIDTAGTGRIETTRIRTAGIWTARIRDHGDLDRADLDRADRARGADLSDRGDRTDRSSADHSPVCADRRSAAADRSPIAADHLPIAADRSATAADRPVSTDRRLAPAAGCRPGPRVARDLSHHRAAPGDRGRVGRSLGRRKARRGGPGAMVGETYVFWMLVVAQR